MDAEGLGFGRQAGVSDVRRDAKASRPTKPKAAKANDDGSGTVARAAGGVVVV